jgi:hypothetical protein
MSLGSVHNKLRYKEYSCTECREYRKQNWHRHFVCDKISDFHFDRIEWMVGDHDGLRRIEDARRGL